jgi:hypothetical protein
VAGTLHGEGPLEALQRHGRQAAVQIGNAAVDDPDNRGEGGRHRSVAAAAEQRQFVADADLQIPGQHGPDDDLLGIHPLEIAALGDEPGQAGDTGLSVGFHPHHLDAETACV